jgi:uncharacterized protein
VNASEINWAVLCSGCGECCGPVPFPADDWARLQHKLVTAPVRLEEVLGCVVPITEDLKCCFLTPDRRCSVYADRPDICRKFGTIVGLPCSYAGDPCRLGSVKVIDRLDARIEVSLS